MDVLLDIKTKRDLINKKLDEILSVDVEDSYKYFKECVRYSVIGDSKRLRPILTLLVYELFDDDLDKVLSFSCAIELVHCASLIIDDLSSMDDAEYRRNKKTTHLVYGEGNTILAAAMLQSLSFKLFSDIKHIKINNIIKDFTLAIGESGLIKGQFFDINSFSKSSNLDELNNTYYFKTGVLFNFAARLGAYLGECENELFIYLDEYSKHLGLAFQIRDDILDYSASFEQIGKDVKVDEKNHKLNYISFFGIKGAKMKLNEEIKKGVESLSFFGNKAYKLKFFIESLKVN
jgi:geranylgeranyl diphosphate synthase, type II